MSNARVYTTAKSTDEGSTGTLEVARIHTRFPKLCVINKGLEAGADRLSNLDSGNVILSNSDCKLLCINFVEDLGAV